MPYSATQTEGIITIMKRWLLNFLNNFVKELRTIIFAVLIAIIVWFAISMQIFPDVSAHVNDIPLTVTPTEYMNEHSLTVEEGYAEKVSVQIRGKRYDVGNLSAEDFAAEADLSSVTAAGEYEVKVNVRSLNNSDCEIEDSNLTIKINVMKTVSKTYSISDGTLKVTADEVVPTDNMKIDSIAVEPSTITLTGDSKDIESVKSVEIRSLFAGEANSSVTSKGKVVLLGANGGVIENPDITYDNTNFTVEVSLFKQKTLPLTVQFVNVPSNFDIDSLKYSIYPETLTVSSPDDSLDAQDKFEVGTIDLAQLTTKYLQRLSLPITLPDGYKNISGNTSAMITFEDAENYTFLGFAVQKENIKVINVPENFDVEVLTNELNVHVTGPAEEIAALSSSDIFVTVNLMGTTLTEGLKDVTAEFTLRGTKVKSWVTGEYKVSISVTEAAETE